ncbi:unnamed protein product [Musa acuminata subsp. malaccensis]|uniref:Uncharacterized protein n=1 Tax=Musa acuminata subsp. malaccensis TaxID=214687 RepID=A0A804U5R9_MUSAM|nr:unnamed protein product [Musa acuminata subsp. malaccensis]
MQLLWKVENGIHITYIERNETSTSSYKLKKNTVTTISAELSDKQLKEY